MCVYVVVITFIVTFTLINRYVATGHKRSSLTSGTLSMGDLSVIKKTTRRRKFVDDEMIGTKEGSCAS